MCSNVRNVFLELSVVLHKPELDSFVNSGVLVIEGMEQYHSVDRMLPL